MEIVAAILDFVTWAGFGLALFIGLEVGLYYRRIMKNRRAGGH